MRTTLTLIGLALALAACSKPEAQKTGHDLKAAAVDVGDAAKDVAKAPAVKEAAADIKQGAQSLGDKAVDATNDAAHKVKEGVKGDGSDHEARTTVTTKTTVTP